MSGKFQIGNKVMIRKGSKFYKDGDTSNPRGVVGTVTRDDGDTTLNVYVSWDNGTTNVYSDKDLKLAKEKKVKLSKGKEEVYVDRDGDQFEVDTLTSKEFVYFTTGDSSDDGISDGQVVRLKAEDVKKIRKQLGKWLDNQAVVA